MKRNRTDRHLGRRGGWENGCGLDQRRKPHSGMADADEWAEAETPEEDDGVTCTALGDQWWFRCGTIINSIVWLVVMRVADSFSERFLLGFIVFMGIVMWIACKDAVEIKIADEDDE